MSEDPIRISVDFNSRTPAGHVVFNPESVRELESESGALRPGIPLTLHDEEIEVEAVLSYDEEFKVWVAIPNWLTQRECPGFNQDSEFGSSLSP